MEKIVIIGCGGHAKSIADAIEYNPDFELVGFISKEKGDSFSYKKHTVVGCDEDLLDLYAQGIHSACIGIGTLGRDCLREHIFNQLKEIGYSLPAIIDGNAVIARDVVIGEGVFVGKNAVVNSSSIIEELCIVNSGAIVEHDCHVKRNTHIAVGGVLCGNVKVGNNSLIGANATIIQGVVLGDETVVGAGSVVLQDVDNGQTVVGNPAEKLNK